MKVDVRRLVRGACNQAIRDRKAYDKTHPQDYTNWQANQKTGEARLARKILRILSENAKANDAPHLES